MKKMLTTALAAPLALGLALTITACGNSTASKPKLASTQAALQLGSGIDTNNMDTSVAPQQDFFQYVNGKWVDNTQIPADKARWGSFDALAENAREQVLELIQGLAASEHAKDSDEQKIADLYQSFLNQEQIEIQGIKPLTPFFTRIDSLKTGVSGLMP